MSIRGERLANKDSTILNLQYEIDQWKESSQAKEYALINGDLINDNNEIIIGRLKRKNRIIIVSAIVASIAIKAYL